MAIGRRGFKTTIGQVWLSLTDHNARPDVFLLFSRIALYLLSDDTITTAKQEQNDWMPEKNLDG